MCGATDVGRVRTVNQDRFLIDAQLGLVIVADGVGGRKRGEVAAEIACRVVKEHVLRHATPRTRYQMHSGVSERQSVIIMMRNALQKASAQVFSVGHEMTAGKGMSCTLDAVLIIGRTAFIAHVGDSRTYLLRNRTTSLLTLDHTLLQEKINRGVVSPEDAKTAKGGNILTRSIGSLPTVQVDTLCVELELHDTLLVCSDGLTRYVQDAEFPRALPNATDDNVDNLVRLARVRGGGDNITAVLIHTYDRLSKIQVPVPTRLLRSFSFFEGCTLDELRMLWPHFEQGEVASGASLYTQDQDADRLFLLVSGAIELHRAHQCISVVRAGEAFGGLSLVAQSERVTTAIAVDDCEYLSLPVSRFQQRYEHGCPVMQRLMTQFLKRATDVVRRQNIAISDD